MYQNYIMLHSTLWIFRSDSSIELLDDMCTEPHFAYKDQLDKGKNVIPKRIPTKDMGMER